MTSASFVTSTGLPTYFARAHRTICRKSTRQFATCSDKTPTPLTTPSSQTTKPSSEESKFEILSQSVLFKRYQTVYKRDVKYPNGKEISFDVLGNERSDFKSVFVFPFDSKNKTVTFIREYSPGRNCEQLSLVAGMFESSKHSSLEHAARDELSEEAQLKSGQLIPLSSNGNGFAADKYSMNSFFYYLAIDCQRDPNPKQTDEEEWIHIVPNITLSEVPQIISDGLLNVPHSLCALLALDKLRHMGYH